MTEVDHNTERRRGDIQGLRAIAVTSVVLYHLGIPGFSGGFVGVDVFFVISGFLITGLLLRQLVATQSIDLFAFWAGRAKRLLPNAALTLVVVLILGAVVLPTYRYSEMADDVTAAALFFANFRFAAEAVNYFNLDDLPSPVMHFWSLSIEEQYYWIWPLLLFAAAFVPAAQRRFWIIGTLLLIVVGSFVLSLSVLKVDQTAAFFHTQTRVWQLAAGGLIAAIFNLTRLRIPVAISGGLAWLGITALLVAIAFYDDQLSYPGWWGLLPVLGTIGLILGGETILGAPIRAALSVPVMQWIGNISYSWYLWHWPTIVFLQASLPEGPWIVATAFPLSLFIADVAYRFVELPFHKGRFSRFGRFPALSGATTMVIAMAVVSYLLRDLPLGSGTLERNQTVSQSIADLGSNYTDKCHLEYEKISQPPCVYGKTGSARSVVLFGDSHAAQWLLALAKAADASGWSVNSWTKSGCPSIAVDVWYPPKKAYFSECDAWRNQIIATLTQGKKRPDLVILANSILYSGRLIDRDSGQLIFGEKAIDEMQKGLAETLGKLTGAKLRVVVLRDTPSMYRSFRECLIANSAVCGRPRNEALGSSERAVSRVETFGTKVKLMDLTDVLCDQSFCPAETNRMIVYRDSDHLTATFATTLWPYFKEVLDGVETERANSNVAATENAVQR